MINKPVCAPHKVLPNDPMQIQIFLAAMLSKKTLRTKTRALSTLDCPLCMVRLNKSNQNTNNNPDISKLEYKFDMTCRKQSIANYIQNVLPYSSGSQLYKDNKNNPGSRYCPDLSWVGLIKN